MDIIKDISNRSLLFVEAVSMIPPLVLDIQPHHKVIFAMNKWFLFCI